MTTNQQDQGTPNQMLIGSYIVESKCVNGRITFMSVDFNAFANANMVEVQIN